MPESLRCWNCGIHLHQTLQPISRHAHCPDCFEVLRCCRMCQNYAPSQPAACSHERAEPPVIKENANFCDFYQPSGDAFDAVTKTSSNLAKADFSALFTDNTVRGQDTDSAATDKLPPRGTEAQTTSRPLNVEQTPNPLDDLFDD